MGNYYEILGLLKGCTKPEIKKAYRKMAKKMHPDVGGDPEKFVMLQLAYSTLIDDEKRADYDQGKQKRSIEDEANDLILSIFETVFSESGVAYLLYVDFVANIKKCIKFDIDEHKKTIKDKSKCLGSIFKLKRKLKHKGSKNDIIGNRIVREIDRIKLDIIGLNFKIKICKRALLIAEDYEFDKYPKPAVKTESLSSFFGKL